MLRIEISKAEETVNTTSFWKRILPQIHLSASYGMHDLMFIDPTSYTPYILPRDAYRMTISLSLNDVLTSTRHTQAILDLHKLRMELSLRRIQQINSRKSLEEQLLALQDQSASLEKEISFIRELLHFNELRFQQGKIEFDALTRSKLELSAAMRSLLSIRHQETLIRLKLSQ
jgi:outer membrane protein TolC